MTIINTTNGGGAKVIAGEEKPASFPSVYPAPDGYDGWSKLTIEAPDNLSADNIKKDVEIAGVKGTYEPALQIKGTKATSFPVIIEPDSDYYGLEQASVTAPENLSAENIRNGVVIAGIEGTYEGSGGGVEYDSEGYRTNFSVTESDLAGASAIGENAFFSSGITSIDMPNTLSLIGTYAFKGCVKLTHVGLPSNLTSLGAGYLNYGCFQNCISLASIILPDTLTSLSSSCFTNCSSLTNITIPSSVTNIGSNCFAYCTGLASVTMLPTTPPTLGSNAFTSTSSNLVITVPKGCLDAYKAATNWSAYADKMVEASR